MHMRTPLGARDDGHMDILSRIHAKHHVGEHEGEHHGTPNVPSGSQLLTLPVGNSGEKIAAYWSLNVNNQKVEHAFIMMHGRYRNGDHYWTIMNDAVESARKSNAFSSSKEVVVVAPEMYSTKLNKGQYDNETLAWGGGNAWIAGAIATHPKGTNLTSMDALDAFLDHFSDKSEFPNLKNITLVGHGGGGLARLVDPVDDLAFPVRLQEADVMRGGGLAAQRLKIGQRLVAIDVGLALAQQVQVRTVKDIDELRHGGGPWADGVRANLNGESPRVKRLLLSPDPAGIVADPNRSGSEAAFRR